MLYVPKPLQTNCSSDDVLVVHRRIALACLKCHVLIEVLHSDISSHQGLQIVMNVCHSDTSSHQGLQIVMNVHHFTIVQSWPKVLRMTQLLISTKFAASVSVDILSDVTMEY